jgi:DNA repair protein RadD
MKVTYHCGPVTFYHEWVAFEHEGWPRRRAEQWWIRFANNEVPDSVDEALDRQSEISKPKELRVIMAGKYPEVIAK